MEKDANLELDKLLGPSWDELVVGSSRHFAPPFCLRIRYGMDDGEIMKLVLLRALRDQSTMNQALALE